MRIVGFKPGDISVIVYSFFFTYPLIVSIEVPWLGAFDLTNTSSVAKLNRKVDGNSNVDTDGEIQLSDRQQDIMSLLNVGGNTTATKMAKLLGTSKRTIDRDISFLRTNGYIRKETKDWPATIVDCSLIG